MNTQVLMDNLPFIIPLLVVQIGLAVAALIHIFKHDNYRIGNRVLWCIVALVLSIVGPVAYFILGREKED